MEGARIPAAVCLLAPIGASEREMMRPATATTDRPPREPWPDPLTVIVGGAAWDVPGLLEQVRLALRELRPTVVVHGGRPRGVDAHAHEVALDLGRGYPLEVRVWPAAAEAQRRGAHYARTWRMLEAGADLLLLFGAGGYARGREALHAIGCAGRAGIPVRVVPG